MQDIDPNAPNYDPAASYFPPGPDIILPCGTVIEFKLSHKGNGKLQKDYYEKIISDI